MPDPQSRNTILNIFNSYIISIPKYFDKPSLNSNAQEMKPLRETPQFDFGNKMKNCSHKN